MPLSGSQKIAVLLCKFTDSPTDEPFGRHVFVDMLARGTGGLNDYWRDVSRGHIDLDGSEVFGWATVGQPKADFLAAHPSRDSKIQGAVQAFPGVDFSRFRFIVSVYAEVVHDAGAAGWGVLADPLSTSLTFFAHETGHKFGLEHSFDTSSRQAESWSAPGEYYDAHDIMSAMGVHAHHTRPLSPAGPGLNMANVDRMGWLESSRLWTPALANSSHRYTFELASASVPSQPGFLAANILAQYIEFRTRDGWDAGIPRSAVLVHTMREPNSVVGAYDEANHLVEWQPGMVIGPSLAQFNASGGVRVTIESFDEVARTAQFSVSVRAVRRPVAGPSRILGGVAVDGGGIEILPGGTIVPVPPRGDLVSAVAHWQMIRRAADDLRDAETASRRRLLEELAGQRML
jgi:hypothetical protein